jgi:hypothetical protein
MIYLGQYIPLQENVNIREESFCVSNSPYYASTQSMKILFAVCIYAPFPTPC